MNITIFGYPRTGKTTLFNLLTGAGIEIQSFAGGKQEPNLRTCPVPDNRLETLSALFPGKIRKPALVDYIDLAGSSYGEIKNESYLAFLRKADGLTHVVRHFENALVPPQKGIIDAAADIRSMEEEVLLADLILVESRLEKLDKELKRGKTPELEKELNLMTMLHHRLESGSSLRDLELPPFEEKLIRSFAFLSRKPLLHMLNMDESRVSDLEFPDKWNISGLANSPAMAFSGRIELEIMQLEIEEQKIFLQEYGVNELSSARFLKTSYDLLNVITFFTIGKEEVKAWTVHRNATAWDAAGEIHSDIQKGFIRAEVIAWDQLIQHGSFQKARDEGSVRLEGKTYQVEDGDVIYFRFNK